jgi:RNA polymerase-binding transcription factor DksA
LYRVELEALTDRLSGTAARLEEEVARPTGPDATSADPPTREPVPASTEGDEEVAQSALLTEEQLLAEARAALARLEGGTFGLCQRCGRAIGKARLDAVPYARHCIRCARTAIPAPTH